MRIIIGNIIALISSLIMIYSGFIKKKNKIIYVQSIQILVYILSNIILGGITAIIVSVLNLFRNILCYKKRLGLKEKIIISILSITLTIKFNNLGILGYLPLVGTTFYLWFMNISDVIKFKFLIIFTMLMWLVYNFILKSYTSSLFNFVTIITNVISIIEIKRLKKV